MYEHEVVVGIHPRVEPRIDFDWSCTCRVCWGGRRCARYDVVYTYLVSEVSKYLLTYLCRRARAEPAEQSQLRSRWPTRITVLAAAAAPLLPVSK